MARPKKTVRDAFNNIERIQGSTHRQMPSSIPTNAPIEKGTRKSIDNAAIASDIPSGWQTQREQQLWEENIQLRIYQQTENSLSDFREEQEESLTKFEERIDRRINVYGRLALGIITLFTIGLAVFIFTKWIDNQDRITKIDTNLGIIMSWKEKLDQPSSGAVKKVEEKKK